MPDLYDGLYPGEVAGHVEAGSFIGDDMVDTLTGPDVGFDGDSIPAERSRRVEGVGTLHTNERIGRVVEDAKKAGSRQPVSDLADDFRCGNVTLQNAIAVRLLERNPRRKAVTVTNQDAATVYVSRNSSARAGDPGTAYLPAGAGRTFTHKTEIYVVGVAGQIVDWVEEYYA